MWHASVAVLNIKEQRTMRWRELSESTKRAAIKAAKSLLDGVGTTPSIVSTIEMAVHYRKAITEEELAQLPAAWCAIPAVDAGGLGEVLEFNT